MTDAKKNMNNRTKSDNDFIYLGGYKVDIFVEEDDDQEDDYLGCYDPNYFG